jgi:hypothetical protein
MGRSSYMMDIDPFLKHITAANDTRSVVASEMMLDDVLV